MIWEVEHYAEIEYCPYISEVEIMQRMDINFALGGGAVYREWALLLLWEVEHYTEIGYCPLLWEVEHYSLIIFSLSSV